MILLAAAAALTLLGAPRTHAGPLAAALPLRNPGFEDAAPGSAMPAGWTAGIGGGARATVDADDAEHAGGRRSLRIRSASPMQAFVYAMASSEPIAVQPGGTWELRFQARGRSASRCYASIQFQGAGDQRLYLTDGDFGWRAFRCRFTPPRECTAIRIAFACDDVTAGIWFDDVTVARSPVQLSDLRFPPQRAVRRSVFPRSEGAVARRLVVYDAARDPADLRLALAALQGLVNRAAPRLYLLHPTNPPGVDTLWLHEMQRRGITGPEIRAGDPSALLRRFRDTVRGGIVYDPALPGSVNAAVMLAGLHNALPLSPQLARVLRLPIIADLRGRWKRSVDAYRWVFRRCWPRMSHDAIAWTYPLGGNRSTYDYLVQHRIFCFWQSAHADHEAGADPDAEDDFAGELLAAAPPNIPVLGWGNWGDRRGITEYAWVRRLSEYAKFVPGSEFCSNLSVHSAIRMPAAAFRRPAPPPPPPLDPARVYVSVNVLDSGDALWYWQCYQRRLWMDPARGSVPIGWCMNPTLPDLLPLVARWFCEQATPADTLFCAISGLGYMNTQVYAARYRPADRERIWREWVRLTADRCRTLGIDTISLYNGAWGEPTPPPGVIRRFTRGFPGLRCILADLGRHEGIAPDAACAIVDGVPVLHTLTRFQVWSASSEVGGRTMEASNAWLAGEIEAHRPSARPAAMGAMAISWTYAPAWFCDLRSRLPADCVMVGPAALAGLAGQIARERAPSTAPAAATPPRR